MHTTVLNKTSFDAQKKKMYSLCLTPILSIYPLKISVSEHFSLAKILHPPGMRSISRSLCLKLRCSSFWCFITHSTTHAEGCDVACHWHAGCCQRAKCFIPINHLQWIFKTCWHYNLPAFQHQKTCKDFSLGPLIYAYLLFKGLFHNQESSLIIACLKGPLHNNPAVWTACWYDSPVRWMEKVFRVHKKS